MTSDASSPSKQYLARLEDLLPAREARRVLPEVEALILDRVDEEQAKDPALDAAEAERRALDSWESPEELAEGLLPAPLTIDLATRRVFARLLMAIFAGHLVFAIVLTVADASGAVIPGFLAPLPREPLVATLLGVLSIFFMDVGLLLVLFVALGKGRAARRLPHFDLQTQWSRDDAWKGLVLVGLLAVVFNVFLDEVFAVRETGKLTSFLAPDLKALLPILNVVLGLFAVRHILALLGRGRRLESAFVDAGAALLATILLVLAATRSEIVRMPASRLGADQAGVLQDLLDRVFLLVFIVGAVLLAVRFVKQALVAWRLVGR